LPLSGLAGSNPASCREKNTPTPDLIVYILGGIMGKADVVDVKVRRTGENIYQFDVSVLHADEGWDHYADKWDVVSPDGTILGTRTLLHPHVDEQPFTRSLSELEVPSTFQEVKIRAHDSIHGYGGKVVTVDLKT
jgi:hypothetical protein